MSTPDFLGEPRTPRLYALLSEIRRGQIRVPRFQRPFVWSEDQRLALVESIFLGYPIGSILVWRTQKTRVATYDRMGPMEIPKESGPEEPGIRQYLLDGHQRMTTLLAALGPGLVGNEPTAGGSSESPSDEAAMLSSAEWPIYFDLEATKAPYFYLPTKRSPPLTWLRLDILYDSYALGEFKDRLRKDNKSRELLNKVQRVADIFRDYTVPVVPIATDVLEQVTTSFKRVNSGGTQMSEVHMINALTWQPSFDLHEELDEIAESLKSCGWADFDPQLFMNICKVHLGFDVYQADVEQLAAVLKKDPDILKQARDAVERAAQVLVETVGIKGPQVLPYGYQLVLLAEYMWGNPPELSLAQKDAVAKWIWVTSLSEYMGGMTNSRFERIRLHLAKVIEGTALPRPADASLVVDEERSFYWQGARARALGLLLAEQNPRDPQGERDPYELLAELGGQCMVKLIQNRELAPEHRALADGPQNRFLVSPKNGRALRAAFEGLRGEEIAASHLVPQDALLSLREGNLVAFLRRRRSAIAAAEGKKAEEVGLLNR